MVNDSLLRGKLKLIICSYCLACFFMFETPPKQVKPYLNNRKDQGDLGDLFHGQPHNMNRWLKWLSPGLLVKRWLLLSATGVLLTGLGVANLGSANADSSFN